MLDKGLISLGDTVRFWTKYSTATKTMLADEEKAAIEILGKNPFEDFNLVMHSAQTGCKIPAGHKFWTEAKVEGYDEIDTLYAQTLHLVIANSKAPYKIGFTGTFDETSTVFRDKVDPELFGITRQSDLETKEGTISHRINKGQLAKILLPFVYEYHPWQAIEDGIIAPFETYVLDHVMSDKLDYSIKAVKATIKGTERSVHDTLEKGRRDFKKGRWYMGQCGKAQANMMYDLPSKAIVVKKLLSNLEGKTVIFGVRKKLLYQITDNVCESKNTKQLIEDFRSGKINVIASSKMISRVISLPEVKNVIMVSYFSKFADFLQSLGRSLYFTEGHYAKLYIFRTNHSKEEKWFDAVRIVKNDRGRVKHKIDLNIKEWISTRSLFVK